MLLHPAITEISTRRDQLAEAVRKGHLTPELSRYAQPGWAYILKEGQGVPALAYPRVGNYDGANEDEGAITYVITTDEEDRDGDVVRPAGAHLQNYRLNPLVFFGHQEKPVPIGVCRSADGELTVLPEERRALATIHFDLPDPDAAFIYDKCKRKILNATSIAFVPIEAWRRDDVRKARTHSDQSAPGWYFNQWDMTELSVVGVPSNPKAVGLEKDLMGACRDVFDRERGSMSPQLQKAWRPYVAQAKGCWGGWCPLPGDEKDLGGGVVLKAVRKSKYSVAGPDQQGQYIVTGPSGRKVKGPFKSRMVAQGQADEMNRNEHGEDSDPLEGARRPDKLREEKSAEPDPEMDFAAEVRKAGEELAASTDPAPMPGYGQIFRGPDNQLWYVGGDGDEDGFADLVVEKLQPLTAGEVTYEAEGFPPKDEGWEQLYPQQKMWSKKGKPPVNTKATCACADCSEGKACQCGKAATKAKDVPCPRCKGEGTITVSGAEQQCPRCNGAGVMFAAARKSATQADIDSPGVPGRNPNPAAKAGQEKAKPNKALSESNGAVGGYVTPVGRIQSNDATGKPLDDATGEGWAACEGCHGDGSCGECGGTGEGCDECGGSGECGACAGEGHVGKSVRKSKPVGTDRNGQVIGEGDRVRTQDGKEGVADSRDAYDRIVVALGPDPKQQGAEHYVHVPATSLTWVGKSMKKQRKQLDTEEPPKTSTPQVLAALYSHAKAEAAYLDGLDEETKGGLADYRRQQLDERMASLKAMFRSTERSDDDLEKLCKEFEDEHDKDDSVVEPGEAGLVEQGQIPEVEEDDLDDEELEEAIPTKSTKRRKAMKQNRVPAPGGYAEDDPEAAAELDSGAAPFNKAAPGTDDWEEEKSDKGLKATEDEEVVDKENGEDKAPGGVCMCGMDVPPDATECPGCGAPVEKAELPVDEELAELPAPEELKEVEEQDGQFWVVFGDGTRRGPFQSEEAAMEVHRQPDVSAKQNREEESKSPNDRTWAPKAGVCSYCGQSYEKNAPVVEAENGSYVHARCAGKTKEVSDEGVPLDKDTNPATEEILERYQHPKTHKWATRKHRVSKSLLPFLKFRKAANGRKYLVRNTQKASLGVKVPAVGEEITVAYGPYAGSRGKVVSVKNPESDVPTLVVQVGSDKTEIAANEYRKSAEPALDDSEVKALTTKLAGAIDDLKALVRAKDLPRQYKAGLKHVADQIWYVGKALTDKGKEQKQGGKGSELSDKGKEQRNGGKGSELKDKGEQQGKSPAKAVSAAVRKKLEETLAKFQRHGVLNGVA